jgi:hypothetical protein
MKIASIGIESARVYRSPSSGHFSRMQGSMKPTRSALPASSPNAGTAAFSAGGRSFLDHRRVAVVRRAGLLLHAYVS